MRKLSEILGFGSDLNRESSVSSPVEQTTTLLPAGNDLAASLSAFASASERMRNYSYECYMVYQVLFSSGCRISEALSIRAVDIMQNGMVRIKGRKKSESRIINCGIATEYMLNCKRTGSAPFQNINRKFVWSVFKKFGIQLSVTSSEKKVVTHALRHLVIASAKETNIETDVTGRFIGHKNVKNTERYGKIRQ